MAEHCARPETASARAVEDLAAHGLEERRADGRVELPQVGSTPVHSGDRQVPLDSINGPAGQRTRCLRDATIAARKRAAKNRRAVDSPSTYQGQPNDRRTVRSGDRGRSVEQDVNATIDIDMTLDRRIHTAGREWKLAAPALADPILSSRPWLIGKSSVSAQHGPLIVVDDIKKEFGSVVALAGVDLAVERGTVLALLGRNGAGKTTLVRILSTLLRPDGGKASIGGVDVVRDAQRARSLIGLAGQAAAVDPVLTGRENLQLVGRLYGLSRRAARGRAGAVLERLSLTAAADQRVFTYSGGMRRRLDLGVSLVGKPLVLIMDEPTAGLDPRSRAELWKFMDDLVREGTTVILTTQYLEEADRVADQIGVLEHGRLIAIGTAAELKQRIAGEVLELRARTAVDVERLRGLLAGLGSADPIADLRWRRITLPTSDPINTLLQAARRIQESGITVEDLGLRRPSLDDVFLTLTGASEAQGRTDEPAERRGERGQAVV